MTPLRAHSSWVTGASPIRAHRPRRIGEIAGEMLAGDIAVVDRLDRAAVILLDAAALLAPIATRARVRPFSTSIAGVGLGIDAGGIIDPHRLLAGTLRQRDLAQRHAQIGRRVGRRINFSRAGNRAGGHRRRGEIGFGERLVHRVAPFHCSTIRSGSCSRAIRDRRDGGGFRQKFPSLRRHDPDQVQRVFLSPKPGTPRNPCNLGR